NVGAFNCTPANTATAVINATNKRSTVPYAAIEADGTVITPSRVRQLETVVAQCRGRRTTIGAQAEATSHPAGPGF
ncbi:MAG: hypothetical protein M1602_00245, partial [Firmicutes bacterium]|nr:hypothetical protein [Bacillota bacterium]